MYVGSGCLQNVQINARRFLDFDIAASRRFGIEDADYDRRVACRRTPGDNRAARLLALLARGTRAAAHTPR